MRRGEKGDRKNQSPVIHLKIKIQAGRDKRSLLFHDRILCFQTMGLSREAVVRSRHVISWGGK